ncbi:MAG: preprotein translocase subunit YajC [Lachnospiraceae bacterium]|nr:preprotein translocase subunit YajC [Lachnospiraceae bacterium]
MGILLDAAADPAAAGGISLISMILMYAVVIGAMWFFLMRPQSKEKKRVAAMISALEIGDCVLTTSGFYGIVIDIKDDMVIVEFGSNKNCRIPMEKSAINRVEKPGEN